MSFSACVPFQAPPKIFKIGLVAPFEGRYRYVGYDAVYAARLAVREINESEFLGNWQLELVAYDDRGNEALAQRVASNLVVDPDVVVVIGHYLPESTQAAAPIYADAQLPLVTVSAERVSETWGWNLAPSPAGLSEAMVVLGAAGEAQAAAVAGSGPLADQLEIRLSVKSLASSSPSSDIHLVYVTLPPVEAAHRIGRWRSSGWDGSVVGDLALALPTFDLAAGAQAEGVGAVTFYPMPRDLEAAGAWIAAYRAMGPHVPEPGLLALPTYEAVYVAAQALAHLQRESMKVDRPQREMVALALDGVERSGWLGRIRWTDDRYWHAPTLYLYRWKDDQLKMDSRLPPRH